MHAPGTTWHPFVPPFGYIKCAVCTCKVNPLYLISPASASTGGSTWRKVQSSGTTPLTSAPSSGIFRRGPLREGHLPGVDLRPPRQAEPLRLLQGVSGGGEDGGRPGARRHDAGGRSQALQVRQELLPEQRQLAPLGASGGGDEVHQLLVRREYHKRGASVAVCFAALTFPPPSSSSTV